MTLHYLSSLFRPRSIAVIGASDRVDAVGGVTFQNILDAGFTGAVYPVNRRHAKVHGARAYKSVEAIGKAIDLAVVTTPAATVAGVIESCARAGVGAAVVMSAGFREVGERGRAREARVLAAARRGGVRFLGPNCFGLMRPDLGLNATFSRNSAGRGRLALVSQSGALCTAILDWAGEHDVGFSSVVSTGIGADIDFGEILDFLVSDPETDAILLYVEGVNDARGFLSGLRAASRAKPITVMKAGRHAEGSRAAVSHTGALVGADDVFDAALARAGVVRVMNFAGFFAAAQILASGIGGNGDRLAVVSNGGGPAVMAMDRLADHHLPAADLSAETMAALDQVLPDTWSHGNPVDVIGDAGPQRYRDAVSLCLEDPGVDGVLAVLTPQAMTNPLQVAEEIAPLGAASGKPFLTCWMGEREVSAARAVFREHRIPEYRTPEAAVDGFNVLAAHHRNQELLLQVPEPLGRGEEPDVEGATMIIDRVLGEGRSVLTEVESKAVLSAFRIPVAATVNVRDPGEALLVAEEIGFPVAMKISSPDITHKSDVGGVRLNVRGAASVRRVFEDMMATVAAARPDARIDGITLQRMQVRPHARELMIGVVRDPVFGPAVSFGIGGTVVEVLADRSVAMPPLNHYLATRLIQGTRVARMLAQFRHLPAARIDSLVDTLLRVSELICELPALQEMDINPLLVDDQGVVAVDARLVVARTRPTLDRYDHMAIHPYPSHLVERWERADGYDVVIRPIRPEDAHIEERFVRELSRQSRYFRFMYALRELTPAMLSRFTQIDYDRELALIAVLDDGADEREIGVARYVVNPDGASCEFAIVLADEWQGKGLATRLMTSLMRAASQRRLETIQGEVLAENHAMLRLLRGLGFEIRRSEDNPEVNEVTRRL